MSSGWTARSAMRACPSRYKSISRSSTTRQQANQRSAKMLIQLLVRDEGTGFLDHEGRDSDPLITFLDSFEASLGSQDKKSFLIVKIPDPPGLSQVKAAL